ncbi:MAG: RNA polymerase factor sigma-32 [Deltaproteobacteria bacterium]
MTQLILSNSLQPYLVQINKFPLLSKDEEFALAVRFRKHNDLDAAHKLITSNLRFVVKIAMGYRNYGLRLADLIQEGNIGLMKAVKKFDPFKGYRLITYAVWWIRSHIQAFILKNWSLVSKGAVNLKKKLFYQLERNNERSQESDYRSQEPEPGIGNLPSEDLSQHVLSRDAECRDLSLDNEIGEDDVTYLDMLPDTSYNPEDAALVGQEDSIVKDKISNALSALKEKERYVIENRFITEPSLTLQEIGDGLGITRERVRQIESEAIKKLKQRKELQALAKSTG